MNAWGPGKATKPFILITNRLWYDTIIGFI